MRASPFIALVASLLICGTVWAEDGKDVEILRGTVTDAARERDIPVKLYLPADREASAPLVLFSHGLGGTNDAATYFGEFLAGHGYVVAAVQHPGSDESVWREAAPRRRLEAMRQAMNGRNAFDRAKDVSLVIDRLLAGDLAEDVPPIDAGKIAVAGHSFGAHTTLLVAGMTMRGPDLGLADDRVRAAIAMSPPKVQGSLEGLQIPVLTLTGTRDSSLISPDTTPEDRQQPFFLIPAPGGALIVFKDGTHSVFSGTGRRPGPFADKEDPERDERIRRLTCEAALTFLDAHLNGNAEAQKRLETISDLIGDAGEAKFNAGP